MIRQSFLPPKFSSIWYFTYLIRLYGAPNRTGRFFVAQCYDNTWAIVKQNWANIANVSSTIGCRQLENVYQY